MSVERIPLVIVFMSDSQMAFVAALENVQVVALLVVRVVRYWSSALTSRRALEIVRVGSQLVRVAVKIFQRTP